MAEVKTASLRESIIESIGNFLYEEKFASDEITKFGILEMINLISDYHEEGNALFPEILLTNNLDFLKTIPHRELVIRETKLAVDEFKNALKLCAPLAINRWIIFIEVNGDSLKYGVVSAEMSETSPSIYSQTVGDLGLKAYEKTTIAYIRNIGQKTVELSGFTKHFRVSLSLAEPKTVTGNEVEQLCGQISAKCNEKYRVNVQTFFEKVIDDALKNGHGNLIGVVDDDEKSLEGLQKMIGGNGGIYLINPIDFEGLITDSEENKSNEFSVQLKNFSSLLTSMLNHDGITIISNKARIIGYHILIDPQLKATDKINGGSRSKAFKSMENCEQFTFCLIKSQDGNIQIWEKKSAK